MNRFLIFLLTVLVGGMFGPSAQAQGSNYYSHTNLTNGVVETVDLSHYILTGECLIGTATESRLVRFEWKDGDEATCSLVLPKESLSNKELLFMVSNLVGLGATEEALAPNNSMVLPQGPGGGVGVMTYQYTDNTGGTQTVSVFVVSGTPAGTRAAQDLLDELVRERKRRFPQRTITPPPPPPHDPEPMAMLYMPSTWHDLHMEVRAPVALGKWG